MKKLKLSKYFNTLSVAALSSFLAVSPIANAAENNLPQETKTLIKPGYSNQKLFLDPVTGESNKGQSIPLSRNEDSVSNLNKVHSVGSLRMIGEQRIPLKQEFQGTIVGGLSGISYDSKSNTWAMISDDRSVNSPARFYTAELNYDDKSFSSVQLNGVKFLKQPDGTNYPNQTQYTAQGGEVPDFEAIRLNPKDGSVWYTSEGNRSLGLNPFVRHATIDGKYLSALPLPEIFKVSPKTEIGSRDNLTFEGMTFAPNGKSLWVSMEAPLYQDGPVPTVNSGAFSRITQYDRSGNMLAQYAYPIEPIPAAPAPGKSADNGVSDILAVSDHKLLTIERAGVQGADGSYKNFIRIYEIDTHGASNISSISLQGSKFKPVKKRLVLDLTTLSLSKLDNIEGISWGRKLANGHDSLVLVSDDNFNPSQVTQFLVFEVLPK